MDASSSLRALNFRLSSVSFLNHRPLLRSTLTSYRLNHYCLSKTPSSVIRIFPLCSSVSCAFKRSDTDHCSNGSIIDVPSNKLLHVVLVSPQIPGNTGCIARTCAASAVGLHLVGPLGYKIDDTKLKRAGLDYWPYVVVEVHESWDDFREYFMEQDGEYRLIAFTKRGTKFHSDFKYKKGNWLVFGSETSRLPQEALLDCTTEGTGGGTLKIPMVDNLCSMLKPFC